MYILIFEHVCLCASLTLNEKPIKRHLKTLAILSCVPIFDKALSLTTQLKQTNKQVFRIKILY